jgi:hypothetical protein
MEELDHTFVMDGQTHRYVDMWWDRGVLCLKAESGEIFEFENPSIAGVLDIGSIPERND